MARITSVQWHVPQFWGEAIWSRHLGYQTVHSQWFSSQAASHDQNFPEFWSVQSVRPFLIWEGLDLGWRTLWPRFPAQVRPCLSVPLAPSARWGLFPSTPTPTVKLVILWTRKFIILSQVSTCAMLTSAGISGSGLDSLLAAALTFGLVGAFSAFSTYGGKTGSSVIETSSTTALSFFSSTRFSGTMGSGYDTFSSGISLGAFGVGVFFMKWARRVF